MFVDMDGHWWLGDLGSAVAVGRSVVSTTEWFSQERLMGKPAKPEYDWYMLAVALVAELHKRDWKDRLIEGGHTPRGQLVAAAYETKTEALEELLRKILLRAGV